MTNNIKFKSCGLNLSFSIGKAVDSWNPKKKAKKQVFTIGGKKFVIPEELTFFLFDLEQKHSPVKDKLEDDLKKLLEEAVQECDAIIENVQHHFIRKIRSRKAFFEPKEGEGLTIEQAVKVRPIMKEVHRFVCRNCVCENCVGCTFPEALEEFKKLEKEGGQNV